MAITVPLFKLTTPPTPSTSLRRDLTLGFQFAVTKSQVIREFGLYYPSGGLTRNIKVSLWDTADPSTPITTFTFNAGTYTAVDYFCWAQLPSEITIQSNSFTVYRIAAFYPGDSINPPDARILSQPVSGFQLIEPTAIFEGGFLGEGDVYPTVLNTSGTLNYFGPNVGFLSTTPYSGPTGQLWPLGVPDPLPVKSSPLIRFSPSVSPTTYEQTLPFDATLGYEFGLSVPKQVNKLGVYYPSGGFTSSITVSVWNDDPLSSPLISTTIPAGVCSSVIDGFCWVSVATTTLNAVSSGTVYRVGAYYVADPVSGSTDPFVGYYPLSDLQIVEINSTYNGGYAAFGNSYPDIPESTPNTASYFGPNVGFVPTPTGQLWPIGSIFPEE